MSGAMIENWKHDTAGLNVRRERLDRFRMDERMIDKKDSRRGRIRRQSANSRLNGGAHSLLIVRIKYQRRQGQRFFDLSAMMSDDDSSPDDARAFHGVENVFEKSFAAHAKQGLGTSTHSLGLACSEDNRGDHKSVC
jgi:hypothetical protein